MWISNSLPSRTGPTQKHGHVTGILYLPDLLHQGVGLGALLLACWLCDGILSQLPLGDPLTTLLSPSFEPTRTRALSLCFLRS